MSKGRRIMTILGMIFAILAIGTLVIKMHLMSQENRAIKLAQEYLSQKYDEEMQYVDTYHQFSFYPQFYRVRFMPIDKPELTFTVSIQDNLEMPDELWKFEQSNRSADNYYIKYFEYCMNEHLSSEMAWLWESNFTVQALDLANIDGAFFSVAPELHDKITLAEMEPLIHNYRIYIGTNKQLSEELLETIADQIFMSIQIIKDNGFNPATVSFSFPVAEAETHVIFDNWREVNSVDQVIALLEALEAKDAGTVSVKSQ